MNAARAALRLPAAPAGGERAGAKRKCVRRRWRRLSAEEAAGGAAFGESSNASNKAVFRNIIDGRLIQVHGRILKCNYRPVKTAHSGLVAPFEDGDILMDEFVRKTIVSLGLWILFNNMGKYLVLNPVGPYK